MKYLDTPQRRLKEFIEVKFRTQAEFARFMNMNSQDVTKYIKEGGSVFRANEKYKKLSDAGLNYNWYLTGEGTMLNDGTFGLIPRKFDDKANVSDLYNVNLDDLKEFAEIPLYLVSAQAITTNTFVSFDDLPVFKTNVGFGLKVNPKTTKAIFVTGDSLKEARIYSGETVVFDIAQEPKNNDLVICNLNGNLIIKKYEFRDDTIYLHSAYNGIKPIVINQIDDNFKILGIVIGIYRQIRKGLT